MSKLDQYLGNPNLKKAHTKSRFTPTQQIKVHLDHKELQLQQTQQVLTKMTLTHIQLH